MTILPVVCAITTPLYIYNNGFQWQMWVFFAICFVVNNMSITSGYHRYFSHRSYEVHPAIEWLYIFFASGTFQGSLLQWCTDHRRHHRGVDTDDDPYNIHRGFLYAHLTWMFHDDPTPQEYPKDLTRNKWIMLQFKYYVWIASFVGFVLPGIATWAIGLGFWNGVVVCGALRILLTQHTTFLINSLAHTLGKRTYTDKHTARDSIICALLTFGEGYHNYHHSFQADYRNGIRWYHWDPTKWWIAGLARTGLARRLKKVQKEEILKARLTMEERMLIAKGASAERTRQLKARIEEAQKRLKTLRESYRSKKAEFAARGSEWRQMMRSEIRSAKHEFRLARNEWRRFRRSMMRSSAVA